MVRKIQSLVTAVTLGVLSVDPAFAANEGPRYTRQECIQKVTLNWEGYPEAEIERTIRQISQSLNDDGGALAPSYAFPFGARNEWYLQFRENCENKKALTEEIIRGIISSSDATMPKYEISEEPVIPSPQTISLKGEYWKEDRYE